ncbi:MAG: hypothetical protein ACRDTX_15705 [Pseudonocardiaceae bacterium]
MELLTSAHDQGRKAPELRRDQIKGLWTASLRDDASATTGGGRERGVAVTDAWAASAV